MTAVPASDRAREAPARRPRWPRSGREWPVPRFFGELVPPTAWRRISRASSSIERPCSAARTRSRRFSPSSRLRIVILAIGSPRIIIDANLSNDCIAIKSEARTAPPGSAPRHVADTGTPAAIDRMSYRICSVGTLRFAPGSRPGGAVRKPPLAYKPWPAAVPRQRRRPRSSSSRRRPRRAGRPQPGQAIGSIRPQAMRSAGPP